MQDFFYKKGSLTVNIGRGFISSFEASVLKKGDVVRTEQIAGEAMEARFNGEFLCRGQIVIIENKFGFRVSDMEPAVEDYPLPSNTDDIIEILPTTVRLAEIKVSLSELKGISYGSIINLGREYVTDEDAELLAAGIPVAAGRVSVTGEIFAIRITRTYESHFKEGNVRASGYMADKSLERVKDYNFTTPDCFTMESLINLKSIHSLFMKNLRIRRSETAAYEVETVDQCTFDEAVQLLDNKFGLENTSLVYIEKISWGRSGEDVRDSQAARLLHTEKHLLQAEDCQGVLSDEAVENIHSFFDSRIKGIYLEKPVFIRIPESGALEEIIGNEAEFDYFTSCLRSGWKNFADLSFKSARLYKEPSCPPNYLKYDMVSTVMIRDKNKPENFMYFIYPIFTLEPILKILG